MTHISKYKLSKKLEKELTDNLIEVLTIISKQDQMSSFLSALLTDTEKLMLAKRVALIIMVKEGYNDTEIATTLHLTRITVAKTRFYYESRGVGYKVALMKVDNIKDSKRIKNLLTSLAHYSIQAAGGRVRV